jgi:dihydroorotase
VLVKDAWTVPASYPFGSAELVPLRAGQRVGWQLRQAA